MRTLTWLAALSLTTVGPPRPGGAPPPSTAPAPAPAATPAPKRVPLPPLPAIARPEPPTGALRLVATWGDPRLTVRESYVRMVPVGTQLFAAGSQRALTVWRWRTGEEIAAVPTESDDPSPIASADGKQIAVVYGKDATAVYDVAARRFVKAVPPGRPLFLADGGALLATFQREPSTYRLWDLASGSLLWERRGGPPDWNGELLGGARLTDRDGMGGLVASADGRLAAAVTSYSPCELTVMDLRTLAPRKKTRLAACPAALRFAPGGRRLVGAGTEFVTWDFETSAAPREVKLEGVFNREGAAISPREDRVVEWYGHSGLTVWSSAGGKPLWTKPRPPFESWQALTAAFSGDGRSVVARDWGKGEPLVAWRADTGGQLSAPARLYGHPPVFEPGGAAMAVTDHRNHVVIVDVASGKPRLPQARYSGYVSALASSPDGRLLAAGAADGSLVLFDAATGAIAKVLPSPEDGYLRPKQLMFSADGAEAAAVLDGPDGDHVDVWSVPAGTRARRIAPPGQAHRTMRIADGGNRVLAEDERPARVGELQDGAHIMTVFDRATGKVMSTWRVPRPEDDRTLLASLATSGTETAVFAESNKAKICDVATGARKRSLDLPPATKSLGMSADGRLLGTFAEDGVIHVLDVRSGATLARFRGAAGSNTAMAFSPDGKWLLIWRWDGKLELFSLAAGAPATPAGAWDLAPRADGVTSVMFAPDGKRLFVGTGRGLVHQLALDGGR